MPGPNQTSDGYFEWFTYRYLVDRFDIKYGVESLTLTDGQIQGIYIERDYDNCSLPIFLVQLALPLDVYHGITKNIANAEFKIVMSKEMERNDGSITGKEQFISDTFVPLTQDNTPFINENEWHNTRNYDSTGDGAMSIQDFKTGYTFIIVKKTDLLLTRTYTNTVLTSTDMLGAFASALTLAGAATGIPVNNVLMAAPDNNTIYNELILLPIPLINQLQYLNNYYGLYKYGAQIFFDLSRIYILKKSAGCIAFDDTEPKMVIFVVYEGGSGSQKGQGSYTDILKRTGYLSSGMNQMSIDKNSTVVGQIAGSNSTIIKNDGSVQEAGGSTQNVSKTFNIMTTTSHNPFMKDETSLRLQEQDAVITFTCQNIDLGLITPNRQYQIISNASNISTVVNHPCRLVSTTTKFIKQGGYYIDTTEIKLVKTVL